MVVKLDVFPHDVVVGLGEVPSYENIEYHNRVMEALNWATSMGWKFGHDFRVNTLAGNTATIVEFKKQKHALLFKVAWG